MGAMWGGDSGEYGYEKDLCGGFMREVVVGGGRRTPYSSIAGRYVGGRGSRRCNDC